MRLVRIFRHRLRSLLRRSRVDADLQTEIDLHLAQLEKEYMAAGLSAPEARRAALHEFGSAELTIEECRDMRRVNLLDDVGRDLIYAFRLVRKSPGFTATAILSLALGIGANTIVFSVLNALLLKPLPVAAADRIWFLDNSGHPAHSFPDYRDIRDRNRVFESLFAYRITDLALEGNDGAKRLWGYLVTGNYFDTLGIKPALGRFFTPSEDAHVNGSPYAVLSYLCWQNRFGGDPAIAGRSVRINGRPYTVLGVAPREFHGTEVFYWPEIWVPMSMQPQIEEHSWLDNRYTRNSWIAGRLKPGISVERADANLATIAAQLAREYSVDEGMRLSLSRPGIAGAMMRGPTRAFAGAVMLLAGLVLFAACVNLASLLTARMVDRERDFAIRLSIGAGRGRLTRQLLTESLLLSVLGGAAGCGLAVLLLGMLSRWRAPLDVPIQFDVTPDWRVFLFALLAAVCTGVLFGLGPAQRAWKTHPSLSLKAASSRAPGRRWASRDLLLPVQIALCCVVLTASLVAIRGLMRSFRTPLGFRPDGAAVIGCDVSLGGYDETRGRLLQQRALEAVARIPGVEAAAYSSSVPLSIDQSTTTVFSEQTTDFRPKNAFGPIYYYVSPDYFHTAGTTLIAGRDFLPADNRKSAAVAIVNQTFARRVMGTDQAVGRRFRWGVHGEDFVQVVGVVEDGKYETLTELPKPVLFLPELQAYSSTVVLIARSHAPEARLAAEMRRAVQQLDPHVVVYGEGGLRQMLGLVFLPMHAAAIALGAFGILALMLCTTGVYGVSAYSVSQRSREIGVRMAIGARPTQVLRFVFGRLGAVIAAGALVGLALGVATAGVLASVVYEASSRDPVVITTAVLFLSLVALASLWGPARRAIRMDPLQALRHD